jgi:hypothetical protein
MTHNELAARIERAEGPGLSELESCPQCGALPCDWVDDPFKKGRDALAELVAENLALRCLMGGGCDANNDGLHTIVGKGKDEFCADCGEMTRNGKSKPWFDEDRLERTIARLATHPTARSAQ